MRSVLYTKIQFCQQRHRGWILNPRMSNNSSSVMPPFPTSNMSKSFHPPGCPRSTYGATLLMIFKTEQWLPGAMQNGLDASVQAQRSSGRVNES